MIMNRSELVACLDKVWPAVGKNALIPKYQSFSFCGNHVQATGGALWIDTPLPAGIDITACVDAAPLYDLLHRMTHEEIDLTVAEGKLTVSATRPKVVSEFTLWDLDPTTVPEVASSISLENLDDLVRGLEFCRFGVSRDETLGAMCGVHIAGAALWACDRYRILRWNLDAPIDLVCSLPVKFLERLVKMHTQIVAMEYSGDSDTGGSLNVRFEDATTMWGLTLTGEYRDLSAFFPEPGQAEIIQLDATFPEVMDRHLGFLKDVAAIDKEVVFVIDGTECRTHGQKTTSGKRLERKLDEITPLHQDRSTAERFEFRINPVLVKDVMGLCWEFKYFTGSTVVLFETPKFQYLVQTRG